MGQCAKLPLRHKIGHGPLWPSGGTCNSLLRSTRKSEWRSYTVPRGKSGHTRSFVGTVKVPKHLPGVCSRRYRLQRSRSVYDGQPGETVRSTRTDRDCRGGLRQMRKSRGC